MVMVGLPVVGLSALQAAKFSRFIATGKDRNRGSIPLSSRNARPDDGQKGTNMKRTSILALLSALAIPALGDGLKITINPHSETEVAEAAAEGFSSVEEW